MSKISVNREHIRAWLEHLESRGFVILRNIMSPSEITQAKSLFWDHIEGIFPGVDRSNMDTWYADDD